MIVYLISLGIPYIPNCPLHGLKMRCGDDQLKGSSFLENYQVFSEERKKLNIRLRLVNPITAQDQEKLFSVVSHSTR